MRKTIYFAHTTLDGRFSAADGGFWEPFRWGADAEMTYNNELFRSADTWVLGRNMYEGIIPWWNTVAAGDVPDDVTATTNLEREFASLQRAMTKVVLSTTLETTEADDTIITRDPVQDLWTLKRQKGKSILLSFGPTLFALTVGEPHLIDELLIVVHPIVLDNGPQLYSELQNPLIMKLLSATPFEQGALVLRYALT